MDVKKERHKTDERHIQENQINSTCIVFNYVTFLIVMCRNTFHLAVSVQNSPVNINVKIISSEN